MQRILVALLAAIDAAIAAAVGIAALLAPLTILWILAFGVTGDWNALWPTTVTLWQFGHAAPLAITLPDELLRAVGIAPEASPFTLSVPPLAFGCFTAVFAFRSGDRAARAGAWLTGVIAGTVAFALLATGGMLTGHLAVAAVPAPLAIIAPSLWYLVGAMSGAVIRAWRDGDVGLIDRLRDVIETRAEWAPVPEHTMRGAAVALAGLTGAGALLLAVAVLIGSGDIVGLFEAARADALGVIMIGLAQLAYMPALVVWAVAWLAGPGFAVGSGTTVSPVGTDLGVVPGIPMLGALPENTSIWMLIIVIVPVAAGALAGWVIRSRMASLHSEPPLTQRAVIAAGIAGITAGMGAAGAALASGGMGPGRLAEAGPNPGFVALALAAEVLIGASITLLSPRHRDDLDEFGDLEEWDSPSPAVVPHAAEVEDPEESDADAETVPIDEGFLGDSSRPGPR